MHRGFEYIKGRETHNVITWRCVKNRNEQCKGKAQTRQINSKQMVKAYSDHNHPPENMEMES